MTMLATLAAHVNSDTIATWAALVLAAAVAWRISRGGGGSAISELSEANRVLEHRVNELGKEVRDLRVENARLKEQTNFSAVMDKHETAAAARSTQMLQVLDLIANRLGPDDNGGRPQ